jgi:nitrogen-specific signal transduction histidine kinase
VRVIDEGPGLAVQPPDRVFEPFLTTRPAFEAAGLGLWAARALVERHGGTLTVETHPGRTVFAMRLPAG